VVVDNGSGLDDSNVREGGMGLANMRHRAEKLGGSLVVEGGTSGGTSLTWTVPLGP
jgi:signal transduction histidine kinase